MTVTTITTNTDKLEEWALSYGAVKKIRKILDNKHSALDQVKAIRKVITAASPDSEPSDTSEIAQEQL